MKTLSSSSLKRLAELYLAANTAPYLYRHYRAEESVQLLAKENTAAELMAMITDTVKKNNRSSLDMATAYAAVVAITFRDFKEISAPIKNSRVIELEWWDQIFELWDRSRTSTGTTKIKQNPSIKVETSETPKKAASSFVALGS